MTSKFRNVIFYQFSFIVLISLGLAGMYYSGNLLNKDPILKQKLPDNKQLFSPKYKLYMVF